MTFRRTAGPSTRGAMPCLGPAWLLALFFCLFYTRGVASEPPRRLVSLAPSITEILFAIGAGSDVVGNTTYCNFPEEAQELAKVGGTTAQTIQIERIVALRPDMIFSSGEGQESVVRALKRLGVRVHVVRTKTVDEVLEGILELGGMTGRSEAAERVVGEMRRRMERIREALADLPKESRPRVFYQVWDQPLMTAGNSTFIGQLIELAGGTHLFVDLPQAYPQISPEAVLQRNPEVILAPDHHGSQVLPSSIASRPGWAEIAAVRTGRIYLLPGDLVSRPGPRLVVALEVLAQLLHPDRFPPASRPGGGVRP